MTRIGNMPLPIVLAAVLVAAAIGTVSYVFSQPGTPNNHAPMHHVITPSASPTKALSADERKFVSDMRSTFTFGSGVQNSSIVSFAEQVCSLRKAGATIADEVPAVQRFWSNSTPGGAIHLFVLAEKDTCPAEQTPQTMAYVVTGSNATVTYGPTGSSYQGTIPMSLTQPLGNTQDYDVYARLQGAGSVSCQIKIDGVVISSASASGGYNPADCRISQDRTESWVNDNNAR